ncbi:MAG: (d)CMP kinase [bacterium]|jgi:CMP/dCMP kinase
MGVDWAGMIIAIDGPAGAGKSTIARALASALGLIFLDTGAMYRAVALACLRGDVSASDQEAVARMASEVHLSFDDEGAIYLDGEPGEPDIRSEAVDELVSPVAAIPAVRAAIVPKQHLVATRHGGLVAEGRDVTTVVFPEADFRFFLDASPRERARRRARQMGQLERVDEIERSLARRDAIDSGRADSPLRLGAGVTHLETDDLDAQGVVDLILATVGARADD